ncbi:hypothetical protein [Soonwooa purpurea]
MKKHMLRFVEIELSVKFSPHFSNTFSVRRHFMKTTQTKEIFDFIISEFKIKNSQIVDFWNADNCAFGIYNYEKTILIYVSTYNKKEDYYFLEIEYQNRENQIFENISRENLNNKLQPILSK